MNNYTNKRLRAIFRVAIKREKRQHLAGYKYIQYMIKENKDNKYIINGIKDLIRSFNKIT